jgi:hypothetical protein
MHSRESAHAYTVAENAEILATFVPKEDGKSHRGEPCTEKLHRSASANQR